MRRILCLGFGLGALLAASGPVSAQATPEGAERLKSVLEAWQPSGVGLSPAESAFFTSRLGISLPIGKWRVEPDGDGYLVDVPAVRRPMADLFKPLLGRTVVFCPTDRFKARRTPAGPYALSGDGPTACRLEWYDGTVSRLVSRNGRISGSIVLADPATVSMASTYDQVTLERGTDPIAQQAYPASPRPTIDRLTVSGSRHPVAEDRADLQGTITLEGLSVPAQNGFGPIAAKKIVYALEAKGMDTATLATAGFDLARHLAGVKAADEAPKPDDDPVTQALLNRFVGGLGPAQRELISVEGLVAGTESLTVGIGSLSVDVAVARTTPDAVRMSWRLDMKGITAEERTPYADLIPTEGVIQLSMDDVPYRQMLVASILHGRDYPEADARSVQGPHTRVGVHFETATASLDLKGATVIDPGAAFGQTGALQLRLTGLDGLVKALQADPAATRAAASLNVVQVMGRQSTLPDGRSARDYDIVIDPSGKVLVNGTDIQALIPKPL